MKIVLFEGGSSSEREISLKSSKAIAKAITNLKHDLVVIDTVNFKTNPELISYLKCEKSDLIFNGLHGGIGENGVLQAVLENEGFLYTGSNSLASSIAMDKKKSSLIAEELNIPVPKQMICYPDNLPETLYFDFPVIIKPNSVGSSVGTYIVDDSISFMPALEKAFQFDKEVLVQQFIKGSELTVSIVGNEILSPIEIKPKVGYYDFENKYTAGKTEYICPAVLKQEEEILLKKYANLIYDKIGCEVYGRVDFMFDGLNFYFLEVNTLPGMTELSLLPMAYTQKGKTFENLIEEIIINSLNKKKLYME
jgi:D-alanine-D-alanine ligase